MLLPLGPVSRVVAGHCGWLTAGLVEVSGMAEGPLSIAATT